MITQETAKAGRERMAILADIDARLARIDAVLKRVPNYVKPKPPSLLRINAWLGEDLLSFRARAYGKILKGSAPGAVLKFHGRLSTVTRETAFAETPQLIAELEKIAGDLEPGISTILQKADEGELRPEEYFRFFPVNFKAMRRRNRLKKALKKAQMK
jgi:hypothetical protein